MPKMKRLALVLVVLTMLGSMVACQPKVLRLATTTSTYDSGLLDELLPVFEKANKVKVEVLAKGTGEAIALGERGDVDVILVHARSSEDKFVADGHGVNRRDVMYNDFVILGPSADPAAIAGGKDAAIALQKIASANASFVSRGDNSGTHKKELALWDAAAVDDRGSGYKEAGLGMGDALNMANETQSYILADRATYLAWKDRIDLQVVVEGDERLFNPYGVIAVNPDTHKGVNHKLAMKFVDFLTSEQGQQMIAEFGKDKYGQALFVPNYQADK